MADPTTCTKCGTALPAGRKYSQCHPCTVKRDQPKPLRPGTRTVTIAGAASNALDRYTMNITLPAAPWEQEAQNG